MALFGLTFGLLEIAFFSIFILLMLVGISFDRRGRESEKWWIFALGLIIATSWSYQDTWTISNVWAHLTSREFLTPLGIYLAVGVGYSLIEFAMYIRRSARNYKANWESFLSRHVQLSRRTEAGKVSEQMTHKELLSKAALGDDEIVNSAAADVVKNYVDQYRSKQSIISLELGENNTPKPRLNKGELSENIGAWTFFWPLYMVSLVIGDLLTEIFEVLSDFFINLSGRFVRMSFSDVFKL